MIVPLSCPHLLEHSLAKPGAEEIINDRDAELLQTGGDVTGSLLQPGSSDMAR